MARSVRAGSRRRTRAARSRGFSLVELMAVVAIMGILATLAISIFVRRAGMSDVTHARTVLRSIGAAQEGYRALNQTYLDVSSGPGNAAQGWYPVALVPPNQKVAFVNPGHADWDPAPLRRGWRYLNPTVDQPVGFSFKVNAGLPNTPVTSVALASTAITVSAAAGTEPWYIAQAQADADADGVLCVVVAASFTPELLVANDGE